MFTIILLVCLLAGIATSVCVAILLSNRIKRIRMHKAIAETLAIIRADRKAQKEYEAKMAMLRLEKCLKEHSVQEETTFTKKKKRKHKKLPHILNEEVKPLIGTKRLVEDGVLGNLYESDKWENPHKRSHYQVKQYKFDKRHERRAKRSYKEMYFNSFELFELEEE